MMQGKLLQSRLLAAAMVACVVLLASCSGGGGDDGGGALVLIAADGASTAIWALVNGVPTVPTSCPVGVFINGRVTFTFDGPVDPASIPQGPNALGSLNIVGEVTGLPAQGVFTVEDDPGFPAGNHRRVVFTPTLPSDPTSPCSAGFEGFQNYQITVPFGAGSPFVVSVGGEPLQAGATSCFRTCGCPSGGGCTSAFMDAVAGGPFVTSTNPPTADPAPAAVIPCSITGNTIQINVSEPLDPVGIDLTSVRVINAQTMAQVPGSIVFHQATSVTGPSRIDYVASSTLVADVTYQVLLGPTIHDFAGNPIAMAQGNPGALRFFATAPVLSQPAPPLVENFDTANPSGATGAATWTGNGFIQTIFPLELTGTGADGPFAAAAGMTVVLDTNELVGGVSRMGIWNFTSMTVQATATVRVVGPYQAHFRCQGAVTIDGTINANAATGPFSSPLPQDKGPEQGLQNNGASSNCEANGGAANAGGGAGGTGSGVTPPPGSPPTFQCMVRVPSGEPGFGPTISGMANTGSPSNITYAGGQGGDSGCFPAAGAGCTVGDLGGLGGAGGTAGRVGEAGLPRVATAACTPTPNPIQPIAQPSAVAVAMVPPISVQSAGSGGGGGGDHWEPTGTAPNNDDQGAGAGGGGGGLRISCVGAYAQGAAGMILARGAQGQTAQAQGGGGGSGSGGEVWIQTFATLTINAAGTIDVTGPGRFSPTVGAIGCSNQAAGGGGAGLVQLEAGQGPTPTAAFNLVPTSTPTAGAVFSAPPFGFSGAITGHVDSGLRYSGSFAPDYVSAVEVFNLGNAPGATVMIRYQGAQPAVNSTQANPIADPATLKTMATGGGAITAANLDELDGFAFIQFIVDIQFPPPPTTPTNAILPSVDSITINLNAQPTCP
jgi:Bacterial Ig-like domain